MTSPASRYRVYGGILESELPFPELLAAGPGEPDWRLRISEEPAPEPNDDASIVGRDDLDDATVRLYRPPGGGHRLVYSDTGTFDISRDGREITWHRAPVPEEMARMDVLSRVFATCFHVQGQLALHASAVEYEGGAIAIVAPKFHGKSTLAVALCLAGARLITDDTLVVTPADPVLCRPGIQAVRLRGEAATHLAPSFDTEQAFKIRGDRVVTALSEASLATAPVPLRALYLLSPAPVDTALPVAVRERLDPIQAGLSIVANLKLGRLLEREGALLGPALDIASCVPTWTLHLQRDMARLEEGARQVLAWASAP